MDQASQIIGALLILVAFAAAQFHLLRMTSYLYLVLNFVGSAILGVVALEGQQWGFVLLETVWAIVSLWGIAAKGIGGSPESSSVGR